MSLTPLPTKSADSKSNFSANSNLYAKRLWPVYQGPRWSCLMKKIRGRKSCDAVPLFYKMLSESNDNIRVTCYHCFPSTLSFNSWKNGRLTYEYGNQAGRKPLIPDPCYLGTLARGQLSRHHGQRRDMAHRPVIHILLTRTLEPDSMSWQ
jgi:hypothetical protein